MVSMLCASPVLRAVPPSIGFLEFESTPQPYPATKRCERDSAKGGRAIPRSVMTPVTK